MGRRSVDRLVDAVHLAVEEEAMTEIAWPEAVMYAAIAICVAWVCVTALKEW